MTNKKHYKPLLVESVKVVVDVEQQRFIGFDGNYCQANKKALGVCDVSTEKEQFAPIAMLGILLIEAGDTITAGDLIASDSEGRAITTTDIATANGYSIDSATAGQTIRIVRGI